MLINNHIKYLLKSPDTSQSSECTTGLISVQNPKISKSKRKFCKKTIINNQDHEYARKQDKGNKQLDGLKERIK
jgi:hypothetical protein